MQSTLLLRQISFGVVSLLLQLFTLGKWERYTYARRDEGGQCVESAPRVFVESGPVGSVGVCWRGWQCAGIGSATDSLLLTHQTPLAELEDLISVSPMSSLAELDYAIRNYIAFSSKYMGTYIASRPLLTLSSFPFFPLTH